MNCTRLHHRKDNTREDVGVPQGLDLNFTRQMTGQLSRHLGVFSRHNRVFISRHKQIMSGPSGVFSYRS